MQHSNVGSAQTEKAPSAMVEYPIVHVWYEGQRIGLYRVKLLDKRGMVLNHGGISFPVGTLLDIVDIQCLFPNSGTTCLSTTVVDNNLNGIRLAW